MTEKQRAPRPRRDSPPTSWDPVARWYDGWVGKGGSRYHRELAIPALLELLNPKPGEHILDLGAGQGVLCPFIAQAGAHYVGVEIGEQMLRYARRHHGDQGRFIRGDATRLVELPDLRPATFDAVVFLLSIQDMDPLEGALQSAAWALKKRGRLVMLMTHPCFRIPRQSGWGWDENRKLRYRRVDRYLTPLPVPLDPTPGQGGAVTVSFHRPLEAYVNGLAEQGLWVDRIRELPTFMTGKGPHARAETLANREIPLFLALRAIKV